MIEHWNNISDYWKDILIAHVRLNYFNGCNGWFGDMKDGDIDIFEEYQMKFKNSFARNETTEEIDKVQNALPKKEYFVKNEIGSALVRFELGKEAIYYVGSNHVSDVEKIKEICKETNNINEINQKWLDYKEKEV